MSQSTAAQRISKRNKATMTWKAEGDLKAVVLKAMDKRWVAYPAAVVGAVMIYCGPIALAAVTK